MILLGNKKAILLVIFQVLPLPELAYFKRNIAFTPCNACDWFVFFDLQSIMHTITIAKQVDNYSFNPGYLLNAAVGQVLTSAPFYIFSND